MSFKSFEHFYAVQLSNKQIFKYLKIFHEYYQNVFKTDIGWFCGHVLLVPPLDNVELY